MNLVSGADGEISSSVTEVWVTFEDVQVHHDDLGWLSIADTRQDVDLLALRASDTANIGRGKVYEGAYGTLRLIVADSWVIADGEEVALTIAETLPDLALPGFDVSEAFFVSHGSVTTLSTRWNLDTQLHDQGGSWTLGTEATIDVGIDGG